MKAGVKVASNQVQFSLIDSRPVFAMATACEKYGLKLLTYGTLVRNTCIDCHKWANLNRSAVASLPTSG
jgi:diketogulonate reductase-like aldo/keto reductase